MVLQAVHDALVSVLHIERRLEPYFRPGLNAIAREPAAALLQYLINRKRTDEGLQLAEERPDPKEEEHLQSIIDTMAEYMRRHYQPGTYQRAGNTKTHGVVRGTFTVGADVPAHMRRGVFAEPRSYPAWIRFSGPGPDSPRDIDDVGFVSMASGLRSGLYTQYMPSSAYPLNREFETAVLADVRQLLRGGA